MAKLNRTIEELEDIIALQKQVIAGNKQAAQNFMRAVESGAYKPKNDALDGAVS